MHKQVAKMANYRVDLYLKSTIVLCAIGTIGNGLSFIVYASKTLRSKTIGIYFMILCINHTLELFIIVFFYYMMKNWDSNAIKMEIDGVSLPDRILCKLLNFWF